MTNAPNSGPGAPPPPVWDAQPSGAQGVRYGGFWLRVVAYIIDAIVLDVALWIVATVLGLRILPEAGRVSMPFFGSIQVIALVGSWLYFSLMESSARGATLGKMAVGLRVVTDQGQRLSFLNATGRFFAKMISAIILMIGFIMVAFTDRKRGLHDMIAGTLVVKVPG